MVFSLGCHWYSLLSVCQQTYQYYQHGRNFFQHINIKKNKFNDSPIFSAVKSHILLKGVQSVFVKPEFLNLLVSKTGKYNTYDYHQCHHQIIRRSFWYVLLHTWVPLAYISPFSSLVAEKGSHFQCSCTMKKEIQCQA